jgi:hypothetical protein
MLQATGIATTAAEEQERLRISQFGGEARIFGKVYSSLFNFGLPDIFPPIHFAFSDFLLRIYLQIHIPFLFLLPEHNSVAFYQFSEAILTFTAFSRFAFQLSFTTLAFQLLAHELAHTAYSKLRTAIFFS